MADDAPFQTIVNQRTHMVVERATGRCLGGFGSNFYRPWVFPLYTPTGQTVLQEFAFDHPFHNGLFVGQNPVVVGARRGNFWAIPPRRSFDDALFREVGRVETPPAPDVLLHARGVRFSLTSVWSDEYKEPLIDEVRVVDFAAEPDATICEMTSRKVAAYGPVDYEQTKFGSIGVRVEPRLLPALGGIVLADRERRGTAEVVHEQESDFVAYENAVAGHGRVGIFLTILDPGVRGPWFIRDYGMAVYNPTWAGPIRTSAGEAWTVGLRVVAYDGELTAERVRRWQVSGLTGADN